MGPQEQEKNYQQIAEERFGADHIASLKKENPRGLSIVIVDDKMAIFKQPDRKTIAVASTYMASNPLKYLELIAENCFVEGDKELLSDDDYFLSLVPVLNGLMETKFAELGKL